MKKRFLAILAAALLPSCLFAQFGVVSPLHVAWCDGYTESLLQQIPLGL